MWPMMGWMFPGTMMFTGILLWVLVIAAAVLLLKWLLGKDRNIPRERDRESPLEALERRYAKGEVSGKEFKMN